MYIFFFIATIVLTIAMLNLLIAIISDTFARVKGSENLTKIWEKWNIITEIDVLHSGSMVPDKENKYLYFLYNDCQIEDETSENEKLQKQVNEIIEKNVTFDKKIEGLSGKMEGFSGKFDNLFEKIEDLIKRINTNKEEK